MVTNKAAGEQTPEAYPLGHVEDVFRAENAVGGHFQHPHKPSYAAIAAEIASTKSSGSMLSSY
jgi:hypothetical protein